LLVSDLSPALFPPGMTAKSSHLTTVTVDIKHETIVTPLGGFVGPLWPVEVRQRQFSALRVEQIHPMARGS
jgi:hypothetical protein